MANEQISADDALQLAKQFRTAATAVGDYCYDNWGKLDPAARDKLRSLEVTLLNLATDLITQSVGIILDGAQSSLQKLQGATEVAKAALQKIANAKKAIKVVTALIGLAAAIPTGNPVSIFTAIEAVQDAAKDKPAKEADKTAAAPAAAKAPAAQGKK